MTHPIDNIKWMNADELTANDYNPNVVYKQELNLLEFSILTHGWLHPLLVTQTNIIIDGFHRWMLATSSKKIKERFGAVVPVVILDLTEPERKLLTIRINRAKGSHVAFKMSDIIKSLVNDHGLPPERIAKEIGGTKEEVELLLMENVFKKLNIPEHQYSKAWYPSKEN